MPDAYVGLIDTFCAKFDLVWAIDTSNITATVIGLHESRVYIFDEARKMLALEVCPDELPDFWPDTRTKLLSAGFDLVFDHSFVACLAFNPQDDQQCRLALEIGAFLPVADSATQRATMCSVLMAARQRVARKRSAKLDTRQRKLAKQGIYVDLDELESALYGPQRQYVLHL